VGEAIADTNEGCELRVVLGLNGGLPETIGSLDRKTKFGGSITVLENEVQVVKAMAQIMHEIMHTCPSLA
jgi:hypothetical protein